MLRVGVRHALGYGKTLCTSSRQHGRVDWNPVYGDNDHEVEPHDGYVIVFLGNALYSNFLPLEEMHCVSSTGHSEAGLNLKCFMHNCKGFPATG